MKIMLLANYFPPEIGSGPHLPYELGESLVRMGHRVTVVTGFPRYNVDVLPEAYRGRFLYRETAGGMTVLRARAPVKYGRTIISRGLVQLVGPPFLGIRAMAAEKPDLVFTWTPPILMGIVARFAAWRFRVPCVVNVQDLFPQALIDLGVLRNRPLIRCFEAMERFVYRTADAITVMSDGNREYLIGKGTRPDKVHTVFNWVDTASIRPGDRMNPFRASHGMHDEFVVLFAGTMGLAQGLSTVVDAARLLVNEPDLLFLLVGDGVDRGPLERRAAGAANVRFLPMQPKETYPQVLASADACLATLKPEVATPTVPSKIATIMAAGRPLLASLPPGDAPRLIRDARAGIVVPAGDAEALANAVLTLKRDREAAKTMGIRGRSYAEKHLSRLACIRRLVEILTRVAPSTATGENGRN